MNSELKKIFGNSIKVGNKDIPVAHLRYTGSETTYVTWAVTGETPALSADNEPLYSVVTVDIDVFSKGNCTKVITEIKKLMKDNEWLWVEDSAEMYEDDTEYYHRTISFEKERTL